MVTKINRHQFENTWILLTSVEFALIKIIFSKKRCIRLIQIAENVQGRNCNFLTIISFKGTFNVNRKEESDYINDPKEEPTVIPVYRLNGYNFVTDVISILTESST